VASRINSGTGTQTDVAAPQTEPHAAAGITIRITAQTLRRRRASGASASRCDGGCETVGGPWIGPTPLRSASSAAEEPFVTVEIDLDIAREAKSTYPRYVRE
jgi:hypothetical protein